MKLAWSGSESSPVTVHTSAPGTPSSECKLLLPPGDANLSPRVISAKRRGKTRNKNKPGLSSLNVSILARHDCILKHALLLVVISTIIYENVCLFVCTTFSQPFRNPLGIPFGTKLIFASAKVLTQKYFDRRLH